MKTFKNNLNMVTILNCSITKLIHMRSRMGYNPPVYTSAFTGFTPRSRRFTPNGRFSTKNRPSMS